MFKIDPNFDRITMKGKALDPQGKRIQVKGTWAFTPQLSWFNLTDKHWINEWTFSKQANSI